MDYKKKYNEALERAKEYKNHGYMMINAALDNIFPELKESEDERIRKEIISALKFANHKGVYDKHISWLEKQGEQVNCSQNLQVPNGGIVLEDFNGGEGHYKVNLDFLDKKQVEEIEKIVNSWNKVQPKFKVGDYVVTDYIVGKIFAITDDSYLLDTGQGIPFSSNNVHLWTIKDAKDGDVLLFEGYYNSIVLFQGIGVNGKGRINYHCKCDLGNYSFGIQGDVAYLGTIEQDAEHYHPATKEQRDLLFAKMKEAGYEWDTNKKELKKVIIEPKFKVGDFIIANDSSHIYQVIDAKRGIYIIKDLTDDVEYHIGIEEAHKSGRLWTIKDSEPGDVLSDGEIIVIFKHFEDPSYRQRIVAYIGLDSSGDIQITDFTWYLGIDKAKPATKEQRDLLFQKMKESGYEWDSEKKELKKTETKGGEE